MVKIRGVPRIWLEEDFDFRGGDESVGSDESVANMPPKSEKSPDLAYLFCMYICMYIHTS